jgi:phage gp46-like protein
MSDVLFYHGPDGGEIDVMEGGADLVLTDTPSTAMYLKLFGGPSKGEWWGDLLGGESMTSETLRLWESGTEITPANLARYQAAVAKDLAEFKVDRVTVSITSPKNIKIVVDGSVLYAGPIAEVAQ